MPKAKNRKSSFGSSRKDAGALREGATPYHVNGSASKGQPRFIDLFCGIGGFRLAFERTGGKCVFSSDSHREKEAHTYGICIGHYWIR
jgi:hypothetical protein